MENKIFLSIIISTWKRSKVLKKILYSLCRQSLTPKNFYFEVIVSDSFSNDGTRGVINLFKNNQNYKLRHINCLINNLSAKRNLGIKKAKSNNLIFLDDDCIPEKYFIRKYLKVKKFKNILFSGVVKYPQKWLNKSNYLKYRQSRHFVNKQATLFPNKFVAMNCGINIRKNLKNKFYFDERFTGYGFEDFEFAKRMSSNKIKLKTIDAEIVHYEYKKNFEVYLSKIYALSKFGVINLKKVNSSFFKDTIYFKIENNFLIKFIILLKLKWVILSLLKIIIFLEKTYINKGFFIIRIGILLSYINGNIDRKNLKLINKKFWYE